MRLTAAEIVDATDGELLAGEPAAAATSFTIDSRVLEPGAAFVALQAERDGHDFVDDAFAKGAAIAIVNHAVPVPPGAALVKVADPLGALAAMGGVARDRLEGAAVVAITGSAGKTTTKDLTAAALAKARRVQASIGSYNNEAGLPLTLLGAAADTEVVVAEMGARFAGNIAELCRIARPTVGVVTHIGLAHAEHLGGRSGIAAVKGELLDALPADGLAVLNADDEHSGPLHERTRARVLRVGSARGSDVRVVDVVLDEELRPTFGLETPWGSAAVTLAMRGEHQVLNAAMAATVALALGVPLDLVVAGLADALHAPWRMELTRTAGGVTVLNDAYNSSPSSADAALRAFARIPVAGRRIAVLGEMRELGEHSEAAHVALGRLAAETGVDLVVAVGGPAGAVLEGLGSAGSDAGVPEVLAVADAGAALVAVVDRIGPGDAVLLKASRAVGLEAVADALARGVAHR